MATKDSPAVLGQGLYITFGGVLLSNFVQNISGFGTGGTTTDIPTTTIGSVRKESIPSLPELNSISATINAVVGTDAYNTLRDSVVNRKARAFVIAHGGVPSETGITDGSGILLGEDPTTGTNAFSSGVHTYTLTKSEAVTAPALQPGMYIAKNTTNLTPTAKITAVSTNNSTGVVTITTNATTDPGLGTSVRFYQPAWKMTYSAYVTGLPLSAPTDGIISAELTFKPTGDVAVDTGNPSVTL